MIENLTPVNQIEISRVVATAPTTLFVCCFSVPEVRAVHPAEGVPRSEEQGGRLQVGRGARLSPPPHRLQAVRRRDRTGPQRVLRQQRSPLRAPQARGIRV